MSQVDPPSVHELLSRDFPSNSGGNLMVRFRGYYWLCLKQSGSTRHLGQHCAALLDCSAAIMNTLLQAHRTRRCFHSAADLVAVYAAFGVLAVPFYPLPGALLSLPGFAHRSLVVSRNSPLFARALHAANLSPAATLSRCCDAFRALDLDVRCTEVASVCWMSQRSVHRLLLLLLVEGVAAAVQAAVGQIDGQAQRTAVLASLHRLFVHSAVVLAFDAPRHPAVDVDALHQIGPLDGPVGQAPPRPPRRLPLALAKTLSALGRHTVLDNRPRLLGSAVIGAGAEPLPRSVRELFLQDALVTVRSLADKTRWDSAAVWQDVFVRLAAADRLDCLEELALACGSAYGQHALGLLKMRQCLERGDIYQCSRLCLDYLCDARAAQLPLPCVLNLMEEMLALLLCMTSPAHRHGVALLERVYHACVRPRFEQSHSSGVIRLKKTVVACGPDAVWFSVCELVEWFLYYLQALLERSDCYVAFEHVHSSVVALSLVEQNTLIISSSDHLRSLLAAVVERLPAQRGLRKTAQRSFGSPALLSLDRPARLVHVRPCHFVDNAAFTLVFQPPTPERNQHSAACVLQRAWREKQALQRSRARRAAAAAIRRWWTARCQAVQPNTAEVNALFAATLGPAPPCLRRLGHRRALADSLREMRAVFLTMATLAARAGAIASQLCDADRWANRPATDAAWALTVLVHVGDLINGHLVRLHNHLAAVFPPGALAISPPPLELADESAPPRAAASSSSAPLFDYVQFYNDSHTPLQEIAEWTQRNQPPEQDAQPAPSQPVDWQEKLAQARRKEKNVMRAEIMQGRRQFKKLAGRY